jgi:hypothetical protein
LKPLPHFITQIDGPDIHFIHVQSKYQNALPMIVTHGWPGSVIEQLKMIEPLTSPTAHGGIEADAFHFVIPSIRDTAFRASPRKPAVIRRTNSPSRRCRLTRLGNRITYDELLRHAGF